MKRPKHHRLLQNMGWGGVLQKKCLFSFSESLGLATVPTERVIEGGEPQGTLLPGLFRVLQATLKQGWRGELKSRVSENKSLGWKRYEGH